MRQMVISNTRQSVDYTQANAQQLEIIPNTNFIHHSGPQHKRTYVGWVNSLGDIMIGGFDHETLVVMPEVTIKAKIQKDDHANPSLLVIII